jgi:hypothetical protein
VSASQQAPLTVAIDEANDLVIVCGVRYAGELFRSLGFAEPGTWLRIEGRRPDGTLTVFTVSDSVGRSFDAMSGRTARGGS